MPPRERIGFVLSDGMQATTRDNIKRALKRQMSEPGTRIGRILVEMNAITEVHLAQGLALQHGLPYLAAHRLKPCREITRRVPRDICEQHCMLPIYRLGKALLVAIADPSDHFAMDNIHFTLGGEIAFTVAPEAAIRAAIKQAYG